MKDNTALYKQLIGSLKEEILNMKEGDKIPSERQLCEIYNISRTTVRNAINDLEHAGHLERIQGKGTFVSNKKNDQQNLSNYYSFTERTKEIGKVPRTVILEYHIRIPSEAVRERIGADEYDHAPSTTRTTLHISQ